MLTTGAGALNRQGLWPRMRSRIRVACSRSRKSTTGWRLTRKDGEMQPRRAATRRQVDPNNLLHSNRANTCKGAFSLPAGAWRSAPLMCASPKSCTASPAWPNRGHLHFPLLRPPEDGLLIARGVSGRRRTRAHIRDFTEMCGPQTTIANRVQGFVTLRLQWN